MFIIVDNMMQCARVSGSSGATRELVTVEES